ncbi:MAG: hypothetical protein AB2L14_36400 [Candidatus Xenobiia bacterium LiM19]
MSRICNQCGKVNRNTVNYCNECGQSLIVEPAEAKRDVIVVNAGTGDSIMMAIHSSKSFVTHSFITLLLYWAGCYFVGLIANLIFLSDADNSKKIAGAPPDGHGCLVALLWVHFLIPLIAITLLILSMTGAVGGIGVIGALSSIFSKEPPAESHYSLPSPSPSLSSTYTAPTEEPAETAQTPAATQESISPTGPEDMVKRYYQLINEKRYDEAFAMRSSSSTSSRDEFINTWKNNLSIMPEIESVSTPNSSGNESVVSCRLYVVDYSISSGLEESSTYKARINLQFENGSWRYNGGDFSKE